MMAFFVHSLLIDYMQKTAYNELWLTTFSVPSFNHTLWEAELDFLTGFIIENDIFYTKFHSGCYPECPVLTAQHAALGKYNTWVTKLLQLSLLDFIGTNTTKIVTQYSLLFHRNPDGITYPCVYNKYAQDQSQHPVCRAAEFLTQVPYDKTLDQMLDDQRNRNVLAS